MKPSRVTIPGKPIALKRHRAHNGIMYDSQKKEKDGIALIIRSYIHQEYAGALRLTCAFIFKYPSRGKKPISKIIPNSKRPDLDNLLKMLMDCIQLSGIIKDDAQIVQVNMIKCYGTTPKTMLEIGPYEKED